MKTRTGFVSNSSSSSFVVRINSEPDCCAVCGRKDQDVVQIFQDAENNGDYESGISFDKGRLKESMEDYLEYEDELPEGNSADEIREALQEVLVGSRKLARFTVGHNNAIARRLFVDACESGQLTLITGRLDYLL